MTAFDRLIAAIEAGDPVAARAQYAPGAKIWHNFDQKEQSVDENIATLEGLIGLLPSRRYDQIVRHEIPGGVVQQHVLRGTTATGHALEMPACIIAMLRDDRVVRIEEYLDTAQAAVLRR